MPDLIVEVRWPEAPEITGPPDDDAKAALKHWTTVVLISMKAVHAMYEIPGPFILDPESGRWREL